MSRGTCVTALLLASMATASAAANKDSSFMDAASDGWHYDATSDTGADYGTDTAWDPGYDAMPPPEDEIEADFGEPKASGRYVFVVNSAEDYVVVIDSRTLTMEIVTVGRKPVTVETAGLVNAAMVINSGSRDVSIIRKGALDTTNVTTLPSVAGLENLQISPSGAGAIVYHDFDLPLDPDAPALDNFQDVVVVDMTGAEDRAMRRTCGYMPREVEFDESGDRAFIVTKAGVSIVDLVTVADDPDLLPTVAYPAGVDPEMVTDVDVDPTGDLAVVGLDPTALSRSVWIMDLVGGEHREVVLPDVPYDIDIAPTGEYAVAVMPATSQIAIIFLPWREALQFVAIPVTEMYAGQAQVSHDGRTIALFSNQGDEEAVGILDVGTRVVTVDRLYKLAQTVAFTPDDGILTVIHRKADGTPSDPTDYEEVADHSYGYSLLRVEDGYVKQELTQANPEPFLVHPDGSRIYLLQRSDTLDVREVQVIYTDTFVVSVVPLGSPPISIGHVPESDKIFVSQDHASGRITFIDAEENRQTVTGFELNDWIVE